MPAARGWGGVDSSANARWRAEDCPPCQPRLMHYKNAETPVEPRNLEQFHENYSRTEADQTASSPQPSPPELSITHKVWPVGSPESVGSSTPVHATMSWSQARHLLFWPGNLDRKSTRLNSSHRCI